MSSNRIVASVGIATLLACAGNALAQGVVGNPATSHNILPSVGGWPGWQIGTTAAPSAITLDAAGDPWEQTLRGSGGNALGTINEGSTFAFNQFVLPSGNPDWLGFEVKLLTAGWQFVIGSATYADPTLTMDDTTTGAVENLAVPGLIRTLTPSAGGTGGKLAFSFNLFNPTTPIANRIFQIRGFIRYVGLNSGISNEQFTGGQVVSESYPMGQAIPTPGSAVLAAAGLSLMLHRRRR